MKHIQRIFAAILCAAILLLAAGCSQTPTQNPSTEPIILDSAAALEAYEDAIAHLKDLTDYDLLTTFSQQRIANGSIISRSWSSTASFANIGSQSPSILVNQSFYFGNFKTEYQEFYQNGTAYASALGSTFSAEMTLETFTARHLPALLLDPALYGSLSATVTNGATTVTFQDPTALESWLPDSDGAQLISATGTAVFYAGMLSRITYDVQYTRDDIPYTVSVTANPYLRNTYFELPKIPDNCPTLEYFDAPRLLLQAAGDVYSARAVTAKYTDTLSSQAFSTVRTQESQYSFSGMGNNFTGQISHLVNVTDYTNTPAATSQVTVFQNGSATTCVNGGEPQPQNMTADEMRVSCEDAILATILSPNLISGASASESDGILRMEFTCNEAFNKKITANIYALFQADLDSYAASFTTEKAEGYLCIDLKTGLPVSMGLLFSRTHSIGDVPYILWQQCDQTIQFSKPNE